MIPDNFTSGQVNHLWQSTVVVAIAWVLTQALRKKSRAGAVLDLVRCIDQASAAILAANRGGGVAAVARALTACCTSGSA